MKSLLTLLVTIFFIAIQFIDIAMFDAASMYSDEIYAQETNDQDNQSQSKQPIEGCEINCVCHSLHHMIAGGTICAIAPASLMGPKFSVYNVSYMAFNQGPPVPPPNA